MKVSEVAWVYVLTVFSIVYATSKLGLPRAVILDGIVAAAILELLTIPLFGALSDRIGRKPMYIAGALLSAAIDFPIFWMLDTRDPSLILITIAVAMSITHGAMFGPQAAYMPELFGTRVRYSGASLGCQISAALWGIFSDYCRSALGLGRRDLASVALSRGVGIDYVDCSARVTRNRQGRHFANLNAGACQQDSFFGGGQRRVVDVHDRLPRRRPYSRSLGHHHLHERSAGHGKRIHSALQGTSAVLPSGSKV